MFDLWTPKSIGIILILWVVHICKVVTLGEKDDTLVKRIKLYSLESILLIHHRVSLIFDLLTQKSIGMILVLQEVHMRCIVTLDTCKKITL
jgi:hypothetical protein